MQTLKYNRIKGPKETVLDYLQSLNNNELQDMYSSSQLYNLNMPDLFRKMKQELQKRKIGVQVLLF